MLVLALVLMLGASAQPAAPAAAPAAPLDWKTLEAPLLSEHVQLTSREMFVKAGEAYFDHNSPPRWVVFQAVPVPAAGEEVTGLYSMYVAKLKYDAGKMVGIEEPILISRLGPAATCGWFHPTEPATVIFGSTLEKPVAKERPGFQVGTNRYVWQFPPEMEIVKRTPLAMIYDLPEGVPMGDQWRAWDRLLGQRQSTIDEFRKQGDMAGYERATKEVRAEGEAKFPLIKEATYIPKPVVVVARPNYDAECSYSKDGRFILYAHVRDEATRGKDDADIWVYDTKTGKHHEIVKADGYDGGPFFSPDGKRICYRSDRKGDDKLQLFVADLKFEDGVPVGIEREHQVTANEHVNWAPFWHPGGGGKFLVYGTSEMGHSNYELFAVEVPPATKEGKPVEQLRRRRITSANGADVLPVFSDDGKWMMWTAQRGKMVEGESKASSQVWAARVQGGSCENIESFFAAPKP